MVGHPSDRSHLEYDQWLEGASDQWSDLLADPFPPFSFQLLIPSLLPPFLHSAFFPFPSLLYPSLHFLSLGLTSGPTRGPRDTHCAHGRTRGRTMGARARERGNEFKGPPPRARRGESGHSFQEVTSSSGSEEHVYELRART